MSDTTSPCLKVHTRNAKAASRSGSDLRRCSGPAGAIASPVPAPDCGPRPSGQTVDCHRHGRYFRRPGRGRGADDSRPGRPRDSGCCSAASIRAWCRAPEDCTSPAPATASGRCCMPPDSPTGCSTPPNSGSCWTSGSASPTWCRITSRAAADLTAGAAPGRSRPASSARWPDCARRLWRCWACRPTARLSGGPGRRSDCSPNGSAGPALVVTEPERIAGPVRLGGHGGHVRGAAAGGGPAPAIRPKIRLPRADDGRRLTRFRRRHRRSPSSWPRSPEGTRPGRVQV